MTVQFIGTFLWLTAMALGSAMCVRALRRRSNNRNCIVGLLLVQLIWFCSILASEFWGKNYGECTFPLAPRWAILAIALIALIVSWRGAREMSPRRRRPHQVVKHGRRRGWLAVTMSVCLLVITGTGIYRILVPPSVESAGSGGKTIVMENLNFRFTPPKRWTQTDAAKLKPASTLAFTRAHPAMFFQIIGENVGPQSTLTVAGLARLARANLKSSALTARFEEERPFSQQGQAVIQIAATAEFKDDEGFYLFRFIVHRSCSYQLICSGAVADREAIEREAPEVFSAFEILHADDGGLQ